MEKLRGCRVYAMVAIKLETYHQVLVVFGSDTQIGEAISPNMAKSSLKFLDISRIYIDKLGRDLELKVNFTYHLSFPILLTDSRVG